MMTRREVVRVFERLAFAAELLDDRRARAWKNAAWALRQLDEDLAILLEERRLASVRGIGPSTSAMVADLLDGLEPAAVAELEAQVPAGLFEVKRIKGLGGKKIKTLWKDLGVASLGELEYACRENRLVDLRGFGPKTQSKVLQQIEELRANAKKRRRDQAEKVAHEALAQLRRAGATRAEVVGDLPCGCELVEALGVVACAPAPLDVALPEGVVLTQVPEPAFGRAVLERTSEPAHLDALHAHAASRGVAWETIDASSAEAVYRALGLLPTPPERRRDAVLVLEGQAAPELVTRAALRGALHNHTTASDGSHSLRAMRDAAAAAQLGYLGITEHSESAFYARGLDAARLAAQAEEIAALNAEGSVCALLTGVESDILEDGSLDYEDAILAPLEVVVASVHKRVRHDRAAATERLVRAASHPHSRVIGHPTGRLLLARPGTEFDLDSVLRACREHGTAIELNANPARLDLCVEHLEAARDAGVLVSIAADAHSVGELQNLAHGVALARRAGLRPEHVLNCQPLAELRAWLSAPRGS